MLIGAGQLVEQGSLAAVLVSCQCEGKKLSFRKGMLICLFVVFASFSKSRMRNGFGTLVSLWSFRTSDVFDFNFGCICKAQGQLVAVDPYFNRITHRCIFHHCHICHGNDSHI